MKKNTHTKKGELILKTLQVTKGFCTAQELHKKIPTINLTTIYRNLEKFTEIGIVQKISLAHQEYAYEYSEHKHHHTVCESCHTIQHIQLSPETLKRIPELSHFDPESIEVIVRGTCHK